MELLDGKKVAAKIKENLKVEVDAILAKGQRPPHLVAILVGNDGASETYVASKAKDCQQLGMDSTVLRFDATITEEELLKEVERINNDAQYDGLIVQMPLPKHINTLKVTETISHKKDVDGFHPYNVGLMFKGLPTFYPATPYGILLMLEEYKIPTEGKNCVVIGRSDIVGKPMSALMARSAYPGNCTVTICHSRTKNIEEYTKKADILIVALGKPEFVKANMVKEGVVVVDVGITRVDAPDTKRGYKLKGDVAFDEVAQKAAYITPVPGGVGLMTRVGLLMNTVQAYKNENL
jgi:methylenetetrahydrofolate dehydrogenase (NADP+)/methenyltetrahydrofolate cyclohydrolase